MVVIILCGIVYYLEYKKVKGVGGHLLDFLRTRDENTDTRYY